ncbi:hypothetical protein P3S68_024259 [Capsicum galapagoense]
MSKKTYCILFKFSLQNFSSSPKKTILIKTSLLNPFSILRIINHIAILWVVPIRLFFDGKNQSTRRPPWSSRRTVVFSATSISDQHLKTVFWDDIGKEEDYDEEEKIRGEFIIRRLLSAVFDACPLVPAELLLVSKMKEMKKEVMKKLTLLEKIFELLIDALISIFLILNFVKFIVTRI